MHYIEKGDLFWVETVAHFFHVIVGIVGFEDWDVTPHHLPLDYAELATPLELLAGEAQ